MKRLLIGVTGLSLVMALAIAVHAADTRGIKRVVVKDREGREVGLYKGSYALLVGVSDYSALAGPV